MTKNSISVSISGLYMIVQCTYRFTVELRSLSEIKQVGEGEGGMPSPFDMTEINEKQMREKL